MNIDQNNNDLEGIAIIGMSCRFPGASDVNEFWENLCNGVESIRFFSDDELDPAIPASLKNDPNYIKARGVLDGVEQFDARFFGMNANESEIMDPQQRLFLQLAWHALENAGYDPDAFEGLIGVYGGMGNNTYYFKNVLSRPEKVAAVGEFQAQIANEKDYLSTRVSYKLNLKGPSVSINTACSTSLVAISSACESLLSYQCDMALAGGISITLPQKSGYLHQEVNIFSKDGHCRPFDAKASGTVPGNGAGIVVLKRLEEAVRDGDLIYGVIKGSAVNNDGAAKMSYMAPSMDGQADAVSMALANSDLNPTDISYIEAHGTATAIGDPIEFEALKRVYANGHDQKGFCGIGSVKSNLGHMDTAAGVAGLIKTVLSLYHEKIPPTLHYESPNPRINFDDSPFYVNNTLSPWPKNEIPRRAGVSSFGVGGTNAHLIVEEAPVAKDSGPSRPVQLILLSAKTEGSLDGFTEDLNDFFQQKSELDLADAAYTLQTARKPFNHRRVIVCKGLQEASEAINNKDHRFVISSRTEGENPELVFMFPGQGSQYVNMGLSFYQHELVFKEAVDACSELLKPVLNLDIRRIIYPEEDDHQKAAEKLQKTCHSQPAIFTVEYALARLWMSWGINPSAMVGHSIGEYVAATIAGVFTLEDALTIVAGRGRLMQELPPGSMLTVYLPAKDLEKRLPETLSIAAVNAPSFCVVSGGIEDIEQFKCELDQDRINSRILKTSHAFHSAMMEPAVQSFKNLVEKVSLSKPEIPFVSASTGHWITDSQATDPDYWAQHLRRTVLFSDAINTLLDKTGYVLLEVGSRSTLTFLAQQQMDASSKHRAISSLGDTEQDDAEWFSILAAMGQLWAAGKDIDWNSFYRNENRKKCSLPGYSFERQAYFIEPGENRILPPDDSADKHMQAEAIIRNVEEYSSLDSINKPSLNLDVEAILADIWKDVLPDVGHIKESDNFFDLGGHSLLAVQFFTEIKQRTGIVLSLSTLFEAPSFGQMLELLSGCIQEHAQPKIKKSTTEQRKHYFRRPEWRALVKIKPEGSKPPFFCVHPIGGNVLCYAPIASAVDADQPIYGLQARGIDGLLEPDSSIEEMASRYIAEIRQVQPTGPYLLGGGSMGGLIAYEMAQQLKEMGEQVSLLVLFDTYGPAATDVFYAHNLSEVDRSLSGRLGHYIKAISSMSFIKKLGYICKSVMVRLDYLKRMFTIKLYRVFSKPLPNDQMLWYLIRLNNKATQQYQVKKYEGQFTLFRSSLKKGEAGFDLTNGWDGMASEGITIKEIPAGHEYFVEHPLVGEFLKTALGELYNSA